MPTIGSATSVASNGVLNIKDYGAKCDVTFGFTGVVTNASATFTDVNATFTQATVGKTAAVGGNVYTVASVQSATSLTLSAASTYSGTSVGYAIGTDDTAAIAAAIAALPVSGGTILVPGLAFDSATHTFNLKSNTHFRGVGGRVGPNSTKGNGLTGGGTAVPASGLIYTGTGTGIYLKWLDSIGGSIKEMAVLYARVSYTGDLIAFLGSNGTTPAMFFNIDSASLGSMISSVNFAANCLVNLSGAVFVSLNNVIYGSAKYHIIGLDPNAVSKGAISGFSNAVTITGGGTEFAEASTASVLNPGSSWQFIGITFEPIVGAKAGAVICSPSTTNLLFSGCGFWDAIVAGGKWVVLAGQRITFRDCYFEDAGNNDIYLDASTASVGGLTVDSCQFDGYSNPTGTVALKVPAAASSFFLTALWFHGNTFIRGATDPVASFSGNANVTVST